MESDESNRKEIIILTRLQEVLLQGTVKQIKKVLYKEYGVKVSSRNENDQCKEIVNICLDMELDVNLSLSHYSTLLHFVARRLDRETFRTVLRRSKGFDINALNGNDVWSLMSLLHFVVRFIEGYFVKDLIDFGVDVNVKASYYRAPLYYAVYNIQLETVEMLLKAGADVNATDYNNEVAINCLFHQMRYLKDDEKLQFWKIIQLLCEHGINFDFNNKKGGIMLYDFCSMGLFEEVKFSVKYGANLFSTCFERGNTILHAAVQGNNFDIIEFLLRNGLDINAKNEYEETPLLQLTSFNRNRYADSESKSEKLKNNVNMIEFLADNGADVNIINEELDSPLEMSIYSQTPEVMQCLLELNANIDIEKECIIFYYDHYNINENSPSDKIDILVLFVAFLAAKKTDISRYIGQTSEDEFKWVKPFFKKCKLEVNRMKKTYISKNNNASYYDFLFNDLMKVAILCRNENIFLALNSGLYKKGFPSYKYFFEKRFQRAQLLKHYMDIITQFLNEYFKKRLPVVIVDLIFSFLKPGDLRNFGRAYAIQTNS